MLESGRNVILVPRFVVVPVCFRGRDRYSGLEFHLVSLLVTPDLEFQRFAEKVDARHTDAVKDRPTLCKNWNRTYRRREGTVITTSAAERFSCL
jgi:hypothetical protein